MWKYLGVKSHDLKYFLYIYARIYNVYIYVARKQSKWGTFFSIVGGSG